MSPLYVAGRRTSVRLGFRRERAQARNHRFAGKAGGGAAPWA